MPIPAPDERLTGAATAAVDLSCVNLRASRSRTSLSTGVELCSVQQGPAEADTVVLLHGWPDSWYSFSRILPLLARQHRAIAIDQRGFGESTRPAEGYTIDDLAGDAVAFLERNDIDQVTLVGHSLGSFVARRAAQLAPARVRRLVLIGTAISAANDLLGEVAEALADLPDPVPESFVREFQAGTLYGTVPESFFDGLVDESRKAPAHVWRQVLAGVMAYDDAGRLGGMAVPTLVVGGDQDAVFSAADQAALAAALPDARLCMYPDTGHCPNWEHPDRLAADLDHFIRNT